ncbi:MAG: signal peptide protein [Cohnella sp.]|nr:signal peptide protein [Cohnella sp.]
MKLFRNLLWVVMVVLLLSACSAGGPSVFHTNANANANAATDPNAVRVPWDYRIAEGKVGDLIGSDMTILPDNELLPNDGNYATGDAVWTLQYMDAELITNSGQRNEIHLSSWNTIKSYRDQKSAMDDLANLKVSLRTEVDLVGVYKTENQGKTRDFAVLTLPSGNRIKQPIDDKRYNDLKNQKKAQVMLEEVHDFVDFDNAYAKFRGWAN